MSQRSHGNEKGHGRTLQVKCTAAAGMGVHVSRTAYVSSLTCLLFWSYFDWARCPTERNSEQWWPTRENHLLT